jgi:hypothetical protein
MMRLLSQLNSHASLFAHLLALLLLTQGGCIRDYDDFAGGEDVRKDHLSDVGPGDNGTMETVVPDTMWTDLTVEETLVPVDVRGDADGVVLIDTVDAVDLIDTIDKDVVGSDVIDPDAVPPDTTKSDAMAPDAINTDISEPDIMQPTCETDEDCLDALEEVPGSCVKVYCLVAAGVCAQKALPDGQSCEAGDACAEKAVCIDGDCKGVAIDCDDGNPCTDDSCNVDGNCKSVDNDAACDDGNPCTGNDTCFGGSCVGSGNKCPCSMDGDCFMQEDGDLCNGFLICVNGSCIVDPKTVVVCEDSSNQCLKVACDPSSGDCKETALENGVLCDDGSVCTTGDACVAGQCLGTGEFLCDDDNSCTSDACDPEAGCVFTPAEGNCSDSNPCTGNDICMDGLCIGEPENNCDCEADEDCVDLEDGDLCKGTLICVAGSCALDPETIVECETPEDDACNVHKCDPGSGDCGPVPVPDGTLCDDEDPCSFASECIKGMCTGYDLDPCDNENPCTADFCEPGEGCVYEAQDGECDDADFCTENDTCVEGFCAGAPIVCDDDNGCTDDSCEPAAGCVFTENSAACDDESVCTAVDMCEGGVCIGTEELVCEEDNPCKAAKCHAQTGCFSVLLEAFCDDANACTVDDICVEGECQPGAELECDDDNLCSDDSCDPAIGCVITANAEPCDDGNACTDNDTCDDTKCVPGDEVVCDDDNVCTTDSCDPKVGCVFAANDQGCNDDNFCTTVDICSNSECVGTEPLQCDDDNLCTDDSCDADSGCVHVNNYAACDDGNICTYDDTCSGGICKSGFAQGCDDANPCTKDTCNVVKGCVFQAIEGDCEDGSVCTNEDTCLDGACAPGESSVCDDENACTSDLCNPAIGCVFANNTLACDDANACTADDVCTDGSCIGAKVVCDDKNDCTDDSCNAISGCIYTPNSVPCEDGSLCSVNDTCGDGTCQPGEPLDCDDDNVCTSDTCIPAIGCVQINNNVSCSDGNLCTVKDKCSGGECEGGDALLCDNQDPCTDDSCDSNKGCISEALPNGVPCDDENGMTDDDKCQDGECVGVGLQCDDDNPCTRNVGIAGIGCVYPHNTAPCDDENVCTLNDVCKNGQCGGTSQLDCDDNNPCTNDMCFLELGCIHSYNASPCNDNNACTEGDTCGGGVCNGGPMIPCIDENFCTSDACIPELGCVFTNKNSLCDDGNPCTVKDHCVGGECVSGGDLNCDDENPCSSDMCIPELGCIHAYNTDPCDDGNACTDAACKSGECLYAHVDCDDGNVCTTDTCNPASGCLYEPNNFPCNDGNICTIGDSCILGNCIGSEVECDDKNPCTVDSCDDKSGNCAHSPVQNGVSCDDEEYCTVEDSCIAGECGGKSRDCDDKNDCTVDSCSELFDSCLQFPKLGTSCDDGNKCTTDDVCSSKGICAGSEAICNDYNLCTDDSCDGETGACVHSANDDCVVLALPHYDTVDCNAIYTFTPPIDDVGWSIDGTPDIPGPLTGTCALNYNNGTSYPGTTEGSATSAFWYDATKAGGSMTLAFHSYNGADAAEKDDAYDVRYVEASTDGFNTVDWSRELVHGNHKGLWYIEAFDISDLSGEKFQLRFRFDSVDSSFNSGPGWFVEDVNVYLGPVVILGSGGAVSETFDDNARGWQFFGGKNGAGWAIDGTPDYPGKFTGSSSLNFNNGADYDVGEVSGNSLSPVIDLTSLAAKTEVSLVFRSWHETETSNNFDKRYVEASRLAFTTDSQQLQEENLGAMKGWKISSLDLTPFAGRKVRVRFRFDTIDATDNNYKGWFVDDVSIAVLPAPVFADGIICSQDDWTYANSTPPVVWNVDATATNPGFSSSDCSLNFNNGTDFSLGKKKVSGAATSNTFTATTPADPTQKLYLDFMSYLGVEANLNYDVTTVTAKEVGGSGSVTLKLPKGADLNKWVQQSIDISSLHGKSVQIIFSFDSVDGALNSAGKGPFIDDVIVRAK